ncbi:MAG: Ig-like domain-containing protein, partial [Chloroflexi bacterium]|nr:Ig-like domain-containing protein [Chloroflexota bacterium]
MTIDTSVPAAPSTPDLDAASDTGTSSTDNLTNLTALSFSGTAEDGATVQLFVDGVAGATTTATGGNWTLTAPSVAAGVRSITARANDPAGNLGPPSTELLVTVDTALPVAPSVPDLQAASDTGASPTDNLTNLTTLSFSGTAEDGATVQLFVDGLAGATTTAAGGAWTLAAGPLAPGARLITARATDSAGNSGPFSGVLSVTVDTGAPPAPSAPDLVAASDTGTSSTDNLTSDLTPTFSATGEAGGTLQLFADGVLAATAPETTPGAYSVTVSSGIGDGAVILFTARVVDAAGNVSAPSAGGVSVTFDASAPGVPSVPDLAAASDTGASSTDNVTNLTTLSFSGTADAGAIVQLFVDGVAGPSTMAAGGAWTIVASSVAAGVRSITARAGDAAGNLSAPSAPLSVTIDTGLPAAPSVPDLDPAADSGTSNADNTTNLTSLTFSGTADAGATVQLFIDGVGNATTTAVGGAWSITATVAPGTRAVTAVSTDSSGNAGPASGPLSVTVDTAAPIGTSVPDLDPASDSGVATDNVTNLTTLEFSGTAETGATVQIFVDGVGGATTTAPGGAWTLTTPSVAVGVRSITARATDAAGNQSPPTAALSVTVDTSLPAASTPDLQAASDSGNPTDDLTNLTSLSFSGTAEDGATVQLFVDGVAGATTNAAAGAWTLVAPSVAPGARTITARATDGAGNIGPLSAPLSITVDTTAPAAPSAPDLDPGSDSANPADNLTNLTSLSFSGTAENGAAVQLFVDGAGGATTIAVAGAWTLAAPVVSPGVHSITARATDPAGNPGPPSAALPLTVDRTLPAAPSAPDLNDASDTGNPTDNLTSLTTLSFSGTAEAGTSVQLFVDGVGGATTTAAAGSWTIIAASLTPGVHSFTARATDPAGNLGLPSTGLSVTIDTSTPAPPSVPDLDAASDTGNTTDNVTSATTPSFSGTADAGATVKLFADAVQVGSATAGAAGSWTIVSSPLADGPYTFTATATSGAGNPSPPSAGLPVTIDTGLPAAPSVPDLDPAGDAGASNADNLTNLTSLAFNGTGEAGATVQLFINGAPAGTAVAAPGWSIGAAGLAEGTHAFTARATDVAGNLGPPSAALMVVIDLTAPAPPPIPDLVDASDTGTSTTDNLTSQTALAFTGTAEADSAVQLFIDGAAGPSGAANGAGAWSIVASPPPGSPRAITARATDAAGNLGPPSAPLSVTVDTSAPPAPSVPDLDAADDTGTSATDNLTKLTTLSFDGTAEDGVTVRLFVDGVGGPSAVAGGGAWTLVAPSLSPGVRAISAQATDPAGNVGPLSASLAVTIDTSAPAAPSAPDLADADDTGASSADNLTKSTSLTFSGGAEDGTLVQLFVGGAAGATTTAAGSAWTLAAPSVAEGVHSITAVSTDAAGNASPASAPLLVTV